MTPLTESRWYENTVKALMSTENLSELATKAGLGLSTLQLYRSDPKRLLCCKLENFYKLMNALGVTFHD